MKKRLASIATAIAAGGLAAGCSTFGCDDYFSYDEILDTWVGGSLMEYERSNNVRPISTLKRPQNRTEYSYRTHDEWVDGQRYDCVTRMTADDSTGEIVNWAYEGNYCLGYCRD